MTSSPFKFSFDSLRDGVARRRRAPTAPVGVVQRTAEFERVFNLPRRQLDFAAFDVTPLFRRPGGTMSFWPVQSAAVVEAAVMNGLFASIQCGGGKSLICLALPTALDSRCAVLLVPATLKPQVEREAREIYSRHFVLPLDRIAIVTYEDLSSQRRARILEDIQPDLIVGDEIHRLRRFSAARTHRFFSYFEDHPGTRFCGLSGTITSRSVRDYTALIELALGKDSPLPRGYRETMDWAGALDVEPDYEMRPGALLQFCAPDEDVRAGYRRRLVESPGVVATSEEFVGASLIIRRVCPPIPRAVAVEVKRIRTDWVVGRDDLAVEMEMVTAVAQALRQVHDGFYYRWKWPDNQPDREWLEARSAWCTEVTEKLSHRSPGMDTPGFLAQAAERYQVWDAAGRSNPRPERAWDSATWERWRAVMDRPEPPKEAVWLSGDILDWVLARGRQLAKEAPCAIWYRFQAVGEYLTKKGVRCYGEGDDASVATAEIIGCSMAQVEGKNLQRYGRAVIVDLPGNGLLFEQLVSRHHREGQLADEVIVEWLGHSPELRAAMEQIVEDSVYQETTGSKRRVLYATRVEDEK